MTSMSVWIIEVVTHPTRELHLLHAERLHEFQVSATEIGFRVPDVALGQLGVWEVFLLPLSNLELHVFIIG